MSADKVQEARHKFFGALYSDLMTGEHAADAKLDALIAAVREDEKARCIAAVEDLWVGDNPWGVVAIRRVIENA